MANTLTIRLEEDDRRTLEIAAHERSIGLSAFVRDLAEAEGRRLRPQAIVAEGERVVAYLDDHPDWSVLAAHRACTGNRRSTRFVGAGTPRYDGLVAAG
ncbi:MAG: hypothetical protein ABR591_04675 [Candidatus Velthaea sp.]